MNYADWPVLNPPHTEHREEFFQRLMDFVSEYTDELAKKTKQPVCQSCMSLALIRVAMCQAFVNAGPDVREHAFMHFMSYVGTAIDDQDRHERHCHSEEYVKAMMQKMPIPETQQ